MVNDMTRLLGLDGLAADRVELDADGVPVMHLSTADEQARCCPGCGTRAARSNSGRPLGRETCRSAQGWYGCGGVNAASTAIRLIAPGARSPSRRRRCPPAPAHHAAAPGRGRDGRRRWPHHRAGRPRPWRVVAGLGGSVHSARRTGPAGITAVAVFLLSDASSFCTGVDLLVDGGRGHLLVNAVVSRRGMGGRLRLAGARVLLTRRQ